MKTKNNKKEFYAKDFFKSLKDSKKIPAIIYLVLNLIFIFVGVSVYSFSMLYSHHEEPVYLGFYVASFPIVYLSFLVMAFSPIGETALRLINKCRKINDPETRDRLEPIFKEVYAKAYRDNPSIGTNIKFRIKETEEKNAFAVGRKTICITSGLLELSDEEIKAVVAHEFGHISNKDTDLRTAIMISNFFISVLFAVSWAFIFITKIILKVGRLAFFFGGDILDAIMNKIEDVIFTAISFICLVGAQLVWRYIGNRTIRFADKEAELRADKYACKLGYGDGLVSFLKKYGEYESKRNWKMKMEAAATIGNNHPKACARIDAIKKSI